MAFTDIGNESGNKRLARAASPEIRILQSTECLGAGAHLRKTSNTLIDAFGAARGEVYGQK